jgi:hypothetical protein
MKRFRRELEIIRQYSDSTRPSTDVKTANPDRPAVEDERSRTVIAVFVE